MSDDKAALREKMRGIAKARGDLQVQSGNLAKQLRNWPLWQSSASIAAFSALAGEPDVLDPWPDDKQIALPRVSGVDLAFHRIARRAELQAGSFGILEPSAEASPAGNEFDLILIPGVAFDRQGGRLGRGKGVYDRFLAGARGIRVGICFKDQIVGEVPAEPHDVRMDFVVTPSSAFRCGS